jgi:hypothetical protein
MLLTPLLSDARRLQEKMITLEPISMNEQDKSPLVHNYSFVSITEHHESKDSALQPQRNDRGGSFPTESMNSELLEMDENSHWDDENTSSHGLNQQDMILKCEVRDADVLLGRGKSNQKQPGNKAFQGTRFG